MNQKKNSLYPPIEPYSTGFLEVDDVHTLYWEQCGNPDGVPVVFLHGGPGSGCNDKHRRYFDPNHYRIILFDQRGSGRSQPFASTENNTRQHLVNDTEKIRDHLNIDKWHIYGGSWGSTLAISYAIQHPKKIKSIVLRGIFLLEQEELDWFMGGIKTVFPETWERLSAHVDHAPNLFEAYYDRLNSGDKNIAVEAAVEWSRYESACASLIPQIPTTVNEEQKDHDLAIARIEAHFFKHEVISKKGSLLKKIDTIRHIPAIIIQGRYDMICPIKTAHKLHKAWPEADYVVVPDGGHSSSEPSMLHKLVEATNNMRSIT